MDNIGDSTLPVIVMFRMELFSMDPLTSHSELTNSSIGIITHATSAVLSGVYAVNPEGKSDTENEDFVNNITIDSAERAKQAELTLR